MTRLNNRNDSKENKMKITRKQLKRIIKEEMNERGRRRGEREPEAVGETLADFWPHGEDEVVEDDGKLKALGSHSPAVPHQTAMEHADINGREKLATHLGIEKPVIFPKTRTIIGDTLYSIVEMPQPSVNN
jgi:hypothetical protein